MGSDTNDNRCIANTLLVLSGAGISVAFSVMLRREEWQIAGILEWIVGGLGALWIFTFVGVLRYVNSSPLHPDQAKREVDSPK